tara:strand:+ start:39 stop:1478 length:1440 start_codon:yes stop_codon:yes gene_type:complete
MAYVRSNAGSGIDKAFDNELITRNELYAILDQLKDESQFHQLEIFEVVDVDTENVGSVIGRYVYSEQGDSLEEIGDRTFLPLNSNIIQYPLRGELWLGLDYKGQQFYISKLSRDITDVNYRKLNESAISENQTLDLSRGGTYQEISPEHADVEVGDTLIQGRFGNFITLTSRQSQGLDESPRITINNQRSIVDLESIDDIGLINVESDEILMTALTDEVNIRALKDININSSQGDVNLESQSNIVLKPRGSTIDFDIKNGGTILSSTKEGIPFPQLDMVGFLKQVTGIQQLFKALTIGVPKLSAVATLPSGVKDIKKGLEGAKNFIDATINLEFLSKALMETKTIEEIKAVLPIPAGFGGIIDDISNITADQIKKLEELEKAATEKIKKAGELQSSLSGTPPNIAGVNKLLAAGDFDSFAGVEDLKSVIANGADPKALQNYIDNGGLTKFEDEVSDLGSVIGSTDQAKSYKNLFNTARS